MRTYIDSPVTVSSLEGMPEDGNRYEVIEGELFVSAAPGVPHQSILGNLYVALHNYLAVSRIGRVFFGIGIVFDDFNGVIPDLVYVSKERYDRILANERLKAAPEIVVEILSPGSSNEKRDRVVKRQLYSVRGVSEYWILDPQARSVEINRKRKEGGLEMAVVLNEGEDLTSPILPDFRVPLAQIFE